MSDEKSAGASAGFTVPGYATEHPTLDHAFRILDEAKPPKARTQNQIIVCHMDELPPGQKRIVDDSETGFSIGVFNVNGTFHALKNVCPHLGAPLCMGSVHGTHRPSEVQEFVPDFAGRILRCPWHGWEFDIVTGKGLYDKNSRVATYTCFVNDAGEVVVQV